MTTDVRAERDGGPVPVIGRNAPGLPGEPPTGAVAIPPEYLRAFSLIAFTMNRFVIDQVIRASRFFDNDAEMMVLFGVLSHVNVAPLLLPGSRPTTTLNRSGRVDGAQQQLRPVRIRDLVQITGRPRETIRRRLDRLEAAGRVIRRVDGYVLNVDSVEPEMQMLALDGARRFVEAARVVESALRDAERAISREASEPHRPGS